MQRLSLKLLPDTLVVMVFVLLAIPAWSLAFLPSPSGLVEAHGTAGAVAVMAMYWIGPIAICILMLRRHFLFIPAFIIECVGLVVYVSSLPTDALPPAFKALRVALAAVMVLLGLALANKDLLFPFFSQHLRFWRKLPRVFVNVSLKLAVDEGRPIALVTENCSLTGMAVSGNLTALEAALAGRDRAEPLTLTAKAHGEKHTLSGRVVWAHAFGPLMRIGLAIDPTEMKRLMVALGGRDRLSLTERLDLLWARSNARQVALVAWTLSVAGSFGMPACGSYVDITDEEAMTAGDEAEDEDDAGEASPEQGTAPDPADLPDITL